MSGSFRALVESMEKCHPSSESLNETGLVVVKSETLTPLNDATETAETPESFEKVVEFMKTDFWDTSVCNSEETPIKLDEKLNQTIDNPISRPNSHYYTTRKGILHEVLRDTKDCSIYERVDTTVSEVNGNGVIFPYNEEINQADFNRYEKKNHQSQPTVGKSESRSVQPEHTHSHDLTGIKLETSSVLSTIHEFRCIDNDVEIDKEETNINERLNLNKLVPASSSKSIQNERLLTVSSGLFISGEEKDIENSADVSYKCNSCDVCFRDRSQLDIHTRVHSMARPFACPECPKRFNQLAHLHIHKRTHSGEKPFGCPNCAAKFSRKDRLRSHMRIHTGEKPYACPHCSFLFKYPWDLKVHLKRKHSGRDVYKCRICQVSFINLTTFTSHWKSHNKNQSKVK